MGCKVLSTGRIDSHAIQQQRLYRAACGTEQMTGLDRAGLERGWKTL